MNIIVITLVVFSPWGGLGIPTDRNRPSLLFLKDPQIPFLGQNRKLKKILIEEQSPTTVSSQEAIRIEKDKNKNKQALYSAKKHTGLKNTVENGEHLKLQHLAYLTTQKIQQLRPVQ